MNIDGYATNGMDRAGGRCARVRGVHPHPTILLKPSLKEFNKPKKEGVIKTPQEASTPPTWDKE